LHSLVANPADSVFLILAPASEQERKKSGDQECLLEKQIS